MRGTRLLALTAPAGAGKTTLANLLRQELLDRSVSILWIDRRSMDRIDLRTLTSQLLGKDTAEFSVDDIEALSNVLMGKQAQSRRGHPSGGRATHSKPGNPAGGREARSSGGSAPVGRDRRSARPTGPPRDGADGSNRPGARGRYARRAGRTGVAGSGRQATVGADRRHAGAWQHSRRAPVL